MTSMQQLLYNAVAAVVTGVNWYGTEANDERMGPPPTRNPPTPYGYVRITDSFVAVPGDIRQMVQFRIGDSEGRQYSRINPQLVLCEVVFARNPAKQFKCQETGEILYFPEPAGWTPGQDDIDRPGYVIRTMEVMFRRQIIGAAIASSINY